MEFSPEIAVATGLLLNIIGLVTYRFIGWNPIETYLYVTIALSISGILFAVGDVVFLSATDRGDELSASSIRLSELILDWLPSFIAGAVVSMIVEALVKPIRTLIERPRNQYWRY